MNRYEGKDRSDSESTSRPHGVEVALIMHSLNIFDIFCTNLDFVL